MTKRDESKLPEAAVKNVSTEGKDTGDPAKKHKASERKVRHTGVKKVKLVKEVVPVVDMAITPKAERKGTALRSARTINERREARKNRHAVEDAEEE